MASVHRLIGLGEGLISALVLLAIQRVRPELANEDVPDNPYPVREMAGYGLLAALGLAVFVAPFACPWPDGLESVATALGFEHRAGEPLIKSPMADYQLPLIGSSTLATALAGFVGTVVVLGAAYALARLLVPALEGGKKDAASGN